MANYDGTLNFDTHIDVDGFNQGTGKLGSLIKTSIAGLSIAFTGAMVGIGAYAVNVGSSFESAMSSVAAISGATGDELEALEQKAKDLGASTKFSASQVADAMTNLAAAGFTTNEILSATPGLLNLASASGEDLATSTSIAASTLRGFGLEAEDTAHVADVLAENANRTNAAVADTGEAMKYVAPVAKAMGISMEETTAAIGIMANAGIQGSQAGTTLRGALTRLVKPTGTMKDVMEELGLEFFDSQGNMKSLSEIIAVLEVGTKDLTQQQKNQALTTLFGQEALSGMLALVDNGSSSLDDLTQAYEKCDGSSSKMAKTMEDNLKGKLTIVQSSLEGLGISIYEKFEEPLKGAVDNGIDKLADLSYEMTKGHLSDALDNAMQGFSNLISAIIDVASKAIPILIEGASFLCENLDILTIAVLGVGSAYLYLKHATEITQAVQTISLGIQTALTVGSIAYEAAQAALSSGLGVTAAAQAALNAIMLLCPTNLLIAGVVGVGAAVAGLTASILLNKDEFRQQVDVMNENIKKFDELKQVQEEQVEANVSEIDYTRRLKEELDTLVDANGKVKDGYEGRVGFILNELKNATGIELSIVDGQIQGYKDLQKEIDETIQKKRAEIILDSYTEAYEEAIKKKTEAVAQLRKFEEDYTNAKIALEEKQAEAISKGYEKGTQQYNNYVAGAMSTLATTEDAYNKQKKLVYDYDQTIADYEGMQAAILSGNLEDIEKINKSVEESYYKNVDNKREAQKMQVEDQKAYIERLKQMQKDGDDWVTDEVIKTEEQKLKTMQDNLNNMTKSTKNNTNPLKTATKEMLKSSTDVITSQDVYNSYKSAGQNMGQGIADGINSMISVVNNALRTLSDKGKTAYNRYNEIKSPSRYYRRQAKYIPLGIAKGIEDGSEVVTSAIDNMSDEAYKNYINGGLSALESVVYSNSSKLSSITSQQRDIADSSDVLNGSSNNIIDYKKLGKTTAEALQQANLTVKVDKREVGRLVKEVS